MMATFMDNYEGNKERTDRWIATYPEGRLHAQIVEFDAVKGYVLVQAKGWRNQLELEPAGVDYAYGYLAAYSDKMRRWMVEDTCTSALMRVMALIMGDAEKSTKETMQQVQSYVAPIIEDDPWSIKAVSEAPTASEAVDLVKEVLGGVKIDKDIPLCRNCHDHKPMSWKTGVSAKTNKPWANFSCFACKDVLWYNLAPDGTWKVREGQ